MSKFYSPSKRGFFSKDVHATIPADSVEISDAEWRQLIDNQGKDGLTIIPGPDGKPILGPHVLPAHIQVAARLALRDQRLARLGPRIDHYRDALELGDQLPFSPEQYRELLEYRRALRTADGTCDLPAQPEVLTAV